MSKDKNVNPKFQKETILSNDERHELLDTFNKEKGNYAKQDYNLFDVTKTHFAKDTIYKHKAIRSLEKYAASFPGVGGSYAHYFLHYGRDAFTKQHSDDDASIGLTIVTLLEKTDNLVGGETLIHLPYNKPDKGGEGYIKRQAHFKDDPKDAPVGERIIPRIIPQEEGESVIYDRALMHSVTQVEQGHRIVLVSWFHAV